MTAYVVGQTFTNGQGIVLTANQFEVRVGRIELFATSETFYTITGYSGAGSGGSVLTPLPLRGGAPACTAFTRTGFQAAGTESFFTEISVGTHERNPDNSISGVPASSSYDFPFDYILRPGSSVAIEILLSESGEKQVITVYFEELRLSWHY
jgi:hypothetical protein